MKQGLISGGFYLCLSVFIRGSELCRARHDRRAALRRISRHFRRRRMARFAAELGLTSETRVLDIGGTPDNWQTAGRAAAPGVAEHAARGEELTGAPAWVAGDGRALPFRDARSTWFSATR